LIIAGATTSSPNTSPHGPKGLVLIVLVLNLIAGSSSATRV
jgi:hypothetical protein